MAVTTIGGLLYGTLLTLVVVPCIYDIFIREKRLPGVPAKSRRRMKKVKADGAEE